MNNARWLLAAVFVLAASRAHAIHMGPDGVGQVLLYPYYTAQSVGDRPYNTYISIVNHDSRGKALRVRFREGRNGREVLSFNLFLMANDAWAGAVVQSVDGAALKTVDASCTDPRFPVDFAPGSVPTREFSQAAYTGANADNFGIDVARMREGYVEVFDMADIVELTSSDPAVNCNDFRSGSTSGAFGKPLGGISGTLTLINVADGMDFTVNAVALQDVATDKYYRPANDPYPDYDAAEIGKASAFVQDGKLYRSQWGSGLAAVEAVLLRTTLANEVVLDAGTASATDWVVTMPTRRLHAGSPPTAPFDMNGLQLAVTFAPRDGAYRQYVPNACSCARVDGTTPTSVPLGQLRSWHFAIPATSPRRSQMCWAR
jgi:hypothetical protein